VLSFTFENNESKWKNYVSKLGKTRGGSEISRRIEAVKFTDHLQNKPAILLSHSGTGSYR